jgi:hypothetical protein
LTPPVVGENAQIADRTPEATEHCGQHKTVRVKQLRGSARRPRRHNLVAGRKNGNPHRPADLKFGKAERGANRDILRPETPALWQDDASRGDVLSNGPHIGSATQPRGETNASSGVDPNVLLHEDRVRAVRHWCARKDAHRASERN